MIKQICRSLALILLTQQGFANTTNDNAHVMAFDKESLELFYSQRQQTEENQADKLYLNRLIAQLENLFKDMSKELTTGLYRLRDESLTTSVSMKDFLEAKRNYQEFVVSIETILNEIPLLPSHLSKAENTENDPRFEHINHILDYFGDSLKNIQTTVDNSSFNLVLPNQKRFQQVGINTDSLSQEVTYSSDELISMRRKMAQLLIMRTEDKRLIDQAFNRFTLDKVTTYIEVFGKSQRYRFQSNDDGLEFAMKGLEEAFWTRSYLRAVYGMPLGSFAIDYKKEILHLDFFGKTPLRFYGQTIRSENELTLMQDRLYSALSTQTGKSQGILKAATPFFSRISSFITFVSGKSQEATANALILSYLIADVEEELILQKAGGLKKLRTHYKTRYYENSDKETYYKALAEKYLSPSDNNEDFEADVARIDAESLVGVFNASVTALENQEDRIKEALNIKDSLTLIRKDSSVTQRSQQRRKI